MYPPIKYRMQKAYSPFTRARARVMGINIIRLATITVRDLNFLLYKIEVSCPMALPIVKKVKIKLRFPISIPVDALISSRIGLKVRKKSGKIKIAR